MRKLPSVVFGLCAGALVLYGVHYQVAKTLLHLAALVSIGFIFVQYRMDRLAGVNNHVKVFVALLVISIVIVFAEHHFHKNQVSDWVYKDFFRSSVVIILILFPLSYLENKKEPVQYSVLTALLVMVCFGLYQSYLHGFSYRIRGNIELPIIYATSVAMLSVCALVIADDRKDSLLVSYIAYCLFGAGGLAVALSGSRGPLIALIGCGLLFTFYRIFVEKSYKMLLAVLVIGFLTVPIVMQYTSVGSRIMLGIHQYQAAPNIKTNSHGVRFEMWRGGMKILSEHPLSGTGFGLHREYFKEKLQENPNYVAPEATQYVHLHNDIINALVWFGIPIGILFLLFFAWLLYVFSLNLKAGFYMQAGFSVAFVFLVSGLTNSPMTRAYSLTLMLLLCAICLASFSKSNSTKAIT